MAELSRNDALEAGPPARSQRVSEESSGRMPADTNSQPQQRSMDPRLNRSAEAIGRGLKIPVVSISPEEAQAHFGWMHVFAANDVLASSAITRKKLGWSPTGPSLLSDLKNMSFPAI